jgi:hypothetical protein
MAVGQAAGVAAALACAQTPGVVQLRNVSLPLLQQTLLEQGALLR